MISMATLPEGIKVMELSKEKLKDLWEKLKDFGKLYSDASHGDEIGFYQRFLDEDVIVFEMEGGIAILDNIVPFERAQIHVSFWDKHLSTRTELLREGLKWIFEVYNLNRIEAVIPYFSHALKRFLTSRLGFKFEGVLRGRHLFEGKFIDELIFSLLREEVR